VLDRRCRDLAERAEDRDGDREVEGTAGHGAVEVDGDPDALEHHADLLERRADANARLALRRLGEPLQDEVDGAADDRRHDLHHRRLNPEEDQREDARAHALKVWILVHKVNRSTA
jgi:hypothetical protein